MNIISKPMYSATITIGKQIGYSKTIYSKKKLIEIIQQFQQQQISLRNIYLSACISKCDIVMSGQIEPHFKIDFINYPKFPMKEKGFKNEVDLLTKYLMDKLEQNRIVVVYHNETKMFEKNKEIDPRI